MCESPARAVRAWLRAVGHPAASHPTNDVDADARSLWVRLLLEECHELVDAIAGGDLAEINQELADVVVVAYGIGDLFGLDVDRGVDEVMRANNSKIVDGQVLRRADGKVMKGPGYRPPDMATVVELTRIFGRSADLPIPAADAKRAPMG